LADRAADRAAEWRVAGFFAGFTLRFAGFAGRFACCFDGFAVFAFAIVFLDSLGKTSLPH